MPFFMETTSHQVSFPSKCLFCMKADTSDILAIKKKQYIGASIATYSYSYREWKLSLPVCQSCKMRMAFWLRLGIVSLILTCIAIVLHPTWKLFRGLSASEADNLIYLSFFLCFGCFIFRSLLLRRFRVVYINESQITFAIRKKSAAELLSQANGVNYKWKLFEFRAR